MVVARCVERYEPLPVAVEAGIKCTIGLAHYRHAVIVAATTAGRCSSVSDKPVAAVAQQQYLPDGIGLGTPEETIVRVGERAVRGTGGVERQVRHP